MADLRARSYQSRARIVPRPSRDRARLRGVLTHPEGGLNRSSCLGRQVRVPDTASFHQSAIEYAGHEARTGRYASAALMDAVTTGSALSDPTAPSSCSRDGEKYILGRIVAGRPRKPQAHCSPTRYDRSTGRPKQRSKSSMTASGSLDDFAMCLHGRDRLRPGSARDLGRARWVRRCHASGPTSGCGFAIARRALRSRAPSYVISFDIRGHGPRNSSS